MVVATMTEDGISRSVEALSTPRGSSGPRHESASQTAFRSVQPPFAGRTLLANRQTDRRTQRPRYLCGQCVEALSLIPGRDINHEGPHRVYQWTDF